MYGKIFHSIYDGTLAEDWRALITFQQLIVLCDADGVVDMTPQSISRRTGIPIEHIEAGIAILIAPDPSSRTTNDQGKRLLPLNPDRDWGWEIVNHKHYRDLRTAEDRREYMRNYMKEKRSKQKLTKANGSKQLTKLANTDTKTDTKTNTNTNTNKASPFEFPEWLNSDVWDTFVEHRKKLKAPMTERAKTLLIKKTEKLEGDNIEILNQSIENGWKGVFAIKGAQTKGATSIGEQKGWPPNFDPSRQCGGGESVEACKIRAWRTHERQL